MAVVQHNGKERKPKKAKWTMVMQIANAHAFSVGFVGIQLTHGYVAALALSSICVIVGMVVSLQARFNGDLRPALAFGLLLGIVVAFVFDSMTMFGLKMVRESRGAKKGFAFLLIAIGIGLSTMSGDQMWGLVYGDWRGLVLAASVSCVIIMVEVWHREHEEAVKHASKNSEAVQTALNTEVEVLLDKKLRQFTHERLNSSQMEARLRERSEANLDELVEAKFAKRLSSLSGDSGEAFEKGSRGKSSSKRTLYREHHEAFVKFMQDHPRATLKMIMNRFGIDESTASKWRSQLQEERSQGGSGNITTLQQRAR